MFDGETINSFAGGYEINVPGIVTLIGSPLISLTPNFISFPLSKSLNLLVRKSDRVVWNGSQHYDQEYKLRSITGSWTDPIIEMTNLSIQRGWKNPAEIMADENISFNSGIGYFPSFVTALVRSFSSINEINLSSSETVKLNTEIQERVGYQVNELVPFTQTEGKTNNILISEGKEKSYRNEIFNFEPYSMYLLEEKSLAENPNFNTFRKNLERFRSKNMLKKNIGELKFPFNSFHSHFNHENDYYAKMEEAIEKSDLNDFFGVLTSYNESVEFNLNVISPFQRVMAGLLRKYHATSFSFNVSDYSGSILLFADTPSVNKIKENVIREYFALTNSTVTITEVKFSDRTKSERISR